MRMVRRSLEVGLLTVSVFLAGGAGAQVRPRVAPPPVRRRALVPPPAANPRAGQNGALGVPQNWVGRVQEMPPAEQEQFLKNNQRFQSLSPEQQGLIRQRLQAWNNLPEEQRQAMLERQQIWAQLPPGQRQQVRQSLMPRWQALPVRRRQVILGKLRDLRGLDPAQRAAKLNDENFVGGMNGEDRQMLRDLSGLGVGQEPK